jgi:DNA-binding response OmpR family regulator
MYDDYGILVVEDDALMRERILVPGLQQHGFDCVVGVGSATDAYRTMLTMEFGAFVIHVGLPDESGLAMARTVRSLSNAGIVLLTDESRETEHLHGLEQGADAYLTKPVNMPILAATISSLLRRLGQPAGEAAPRAANGKWRIRMKGWALVSPLGRTICLTNAERLFVDLLFARKGLVVTREAIARRLSEDTFDFDPHRIEVLVYRLRRKVKEETDEPFPLRAVRGSGYVLMLP